jgi:hypothetical protein
VPRRRDVKRHTTSSSAALVGFGSSLLAVQAGEADVLDMAASGAERDDGLKALDARGLVVAPDLMAFDRVLGAAAIADLAPVAGSAVAVAAYPVPVLVRQLGAQVR